MNNQNGKSLLGVVPDLFDLSSFHSMYSMGLRSQSPMSFEGKRIVNTLWSAFCDLAGKVEVELVMYKLVIISNPRSPKLRRLLINVILKLA